MSNEFRDKLRSLQFTTSWMPSRGQKFYDTDSITRDFKLPEEEIAERTQGVGPLRRAKDGFYKKDHLTGDYVKASEKDLDAVLFSGEPHEEIIELASQDGPPPPG